MNAPRTEKGLNKKKVFIVDDHSIMREGLSEFINRERDFIVCGEAGNASDAFQAIADCKPDIAIVDITLEDSSGIKLTEDLTTYHPDLPVLVLSMHDESLYAERCLKAGAKGYMMKNESSKKIISAMRSIIKGKIYASDNLGTLIMHNLFSSKTRAPASPAELLTNRELELYQLLGHGLKRRGLAEKMNLSMKTIDNYMLKIRQKMNFKDMYDIIIHAMQNRLSQ